MEPSISLPVSFTFASNRSRGLQKCGSIKPIQSSDSELITLIRLELLHSIAKEGIGSYKLSKYCNMAFNDSIIMLPS